MMKLQTWFVGALSPPQIWLKNDVGQRLHWWKVSACSPVEDIFGQLQYTTHTQSFYCSSGIFPGLTGWAGTRKVKPGKVKPIWIYWSKR